mgnify:CR=1 FL=1
MAKGWELPHMETTWDPLCWTEHISRQRRSPCTSNIQQMHTFRACLQPSLGNIQNPWKTLRFSTFFLQNVLKHKTVSCRNVKRTCFSMSLGEPGSPRGLQKWKSGSLGGAWNDPLTSFWGAWKGSIFVPGTCKSPLPVLGFCGFAADRA